MYVAANESWSANAGAAPISPTMLSMNATVPFAAIIAVTIASTISRRIRFLFQMKARLDPRVRTRFT